MATSIAPPSSCDDHRLRIGEDLDLDAIQVRLAGLPVVRVLLERDVVALDPLDERERSRADGLVLLGRCLRIDEYWSRPAR